MSDDTIEPIAFVVLTSKPGQYRTEAIGNLTPIEAWDYVYCGRHLMTFVIAALYGEARIRVTDESDDASVSDMPIRLLEKFPSRDAAFDTLETLINKCGPIAYLQRRAANSATRLGHAPIAH